MSKCKECSHNAVCGYTHFDDTDACCEFDAQRETGEWKYEEFPDCGQVSTRVVCPFCGRLDIIYDWQNSKEAKECHDKEERNFCPKCGAKLNGTKKGEDNEGPKEK